MTTRRAQLIGLVPAAAGVAAGTSAGAEPVATPVTVESFHVQQLAWGPCADFARSADDRRSFASSGFECTHLLVPLDHADPAGRTARIGVLRRAAAEPDRRVEALVVNPGGPGASGMSAAAAVARRMPVGELAGRFDIVDFDPRGVGASEPTVSCRTAPERDADRADVDLDTSPAGVAATEAEERDLARRCAERTGTDVLARLGSRDVAAISTCCVPRSVNPD